MTNSLSSNINSHSHGRNNIQNILYQQMLSAGAKNSLKKLENNATLTSPTNTSSILKTESNQGMNSYLCIKYFK